MKFYHRNRKRTSVHIYYDYDYDYLVFKHDLQMKVNEMIDNDILLSS